MRVTVIGLFTYVLEVSCMWRQDMHTNVYLKILKETDLSGGQFTIRLKDGGLPIGTRVH